MSFQDEYDEIMAKHDKVTKFKNKINSDFQQMISLNLWIIEALSDPQNEKKEKEIASFKKQFPKIYKKIMKEVNDF